MDDDQTIRNQQFSHFYQLEHENEAHKITYTESFELCFTFIGFK